MVVVEVSLKVNSLKMSIERITQTCRTTVNYYLTAYYSCFLCIPRSHLYNKLEELFRIERYGGKNDTKSMPWTVVARILPIKLAIAVTVVWGSNTVV